MTIRLAAAVCILGLVLSVTASAAAPPGKLEASKSASGAFAVAAANATIKKPHHVWVRLVGAGVSNGLAVVGCKHNLSISSNDYRYKRAGTYRLPIRPAGAAACEVIASIGGSGRIRVEVRAD